jgi:hypothetical protein
MKRGKAAKGRNNTEKGKGNRKIRVGEVQRKITRAIILKQASCPATALLSPSPKESLALR